MRPSGRRSESTGNSSNTTTITGGRRAATLGGAAASARMSKTTTGTYRRIGIGGTLAGAAVASWPLAAADGVEMEPRIPAVPYTLRNLKQDLEDVGSNFDGAPDLEFRFATDALGLEQSGLSYQRVPPGYRFPYGHTHTKQEEVYVIVRGSGRMKLDDEIVELEEWDVVRVPPGTWRGYEAGPEGVEILVIGAPNLGEDPREDVDGQRDWWAG